MRLPTYEEQNEFIIRNIAPFFFGDSRGIKDVFSRMYDSIRGVAGDFATEVALTLGSNAYGTVKVPESQPVNAVLIAGPDGEAPAPKDVIGEDEYFEGAPDFRKSLDTRIRDYRESEFGNMNLCNVISYSWYTTDKSGFSLLDLEKLAKEIGADKPNGFDKGPGAAA